MNKKVIVGVLVVIAIGIFVVAANSSTPHRSYVKSTGWEDGAAYEFKAIPGVGFDTFIEKEREFPNYVDPSLIDNDTACHWVKPFSRTRRGQAEYVRGHYRCH